MLVIVSFFSEIASFLAEMCIGMARHGKGARIIYQNGCGIHLYWHSEEDKSIYGSFLL